MILNNQYFFQNYVQNVEFMCNSIAEQLLMQKRKPLHLFYGTGCHRIRN